MHLNTSEKMQIALKIMKKKNNANFVDGLWKKLKFLQNISEKTRILTKDHRKDASFAKGLCKKHELHQIIAEKSKFRQKIMGRKKEGSEILPNDCRKK